MSPAGPALHEPFKVQAARERALSPAAQARLTELQQVACEPTRLAIVQALRIGAMTVGDIAAAVARPLPATSQHLRVLRQMGVVHRERRGQQVYYDLCASPTTGAALAVLDRANLMASVERADHG